MKTDNKKKICLVTGGSGLVGSHLKDILPNAVYVSSGDFDLTDMRDVHWMMKSYRPNTVIHLAARVGGIIDNIKHPVEYLEEFMLSQIPRVEDDEVIVYAAVQGKDAQGVLRRVEQDYRILPLKIGNGILRAIQTTTAAGMAECARMLLTKEITGPLLQSQIDPQEFLNGPFVSAIYTQ